MNKAKYLWLGGLATVLMFSALGASAQVPSAGTRQDIRDTRANTTQARMQSFGDRLELRLTAALQRADNLRQRVAERVNQFPTPVKFDRVLVDQKLAEAAQAIAAGRQQVATIDAEVAKATAAANPATAFAGLRTAVREIIGSVRLAHQKLVEAIRLIKSAYPTPPPAPPATNQ